MSRYMLLLALLVCACGEKDDYEDPGDTGLLSDVPESVETDPGLIPEVGGSTTPDRTEHRLADAFPTAEDDPAPDYDELRGARVSESKSGGWVLRSSGGGSYGRGRSGAGGLLRKMAEGATGVEAPSMALEEAEHDMAEPMEALGYLDDATVASTTAGPKRDRVRRRPDVDVPYVPAANPMKAGTTDDNDAFGEYLEFLATWTDGMGGSYVPTDVHGRQYVRVVDGEGVPLPGATVRIAAGGEIVQSARTYGDGTSPFYPHLGGAFAGVTQDGYAVEITYKGERRVVPWDAHEPLTVQLEREVPLEQAVPVDVVFLIDTTGSMSDEIARIKSTLLSVTDQLRSQDRPVELRYGAVLYRDIGDEYVTKRHGFTRDIKAFDSALQGIQANGGGDGPESLNQGLAEAVHAMEWRGTSAKVVFLVADAPPHMDYQGDVPYADSAMAAVGKGIRVHTVAASGLDGYGGTGSLIYRQTAQLTQGKFIFIEYGSTAASAASHGVTGPVKSNNLDDIIYEQVRAEVEGWRQPGAMVASR